jgi:uncharacterized protein YkwD
MQSDRGSRRRLLARVLAVPAALAVAALPAPPPTVARKNKRKQRHKHHQRRHKGGSSHAAAVYAPDAEESAFLPLLNAYRAQNGAGRLSMQHQLGAAAEHHAQDMAEKNYVSHTLANGDSPLKNIERYGYDGFTYWGEVIAAGFETAEEAISALKTSPSHDEMMRSKHFNHTGIGRAYSADAEWGWYWTITFGKKG